MQCISRKTKHVYSHREFLDREPKSLLVSTVRDDTETVFPSAAGSEQAQPCQQDVGSTEFFLHPRDEGADDRINVSQGTVCLGGWHGEDLQVLEVEPL